MGKAADNERIKLKATYLNNIAVGCFVAGFIVPYLALTRDIPVISQSFHDLIAGKLTLSELDIQKIIVNIVAFALAIYTSKRLRSRTDKEISRIKD